jgi:hypothetical protein
MWSREVQETVNNLEHVEEKVAYIERRADAPVQKEPPRARHRRLLRQSASIGRRPDVNRRTGAAHRLFVAEGSCRDLPVQRFYRKWASRAIERPECGPVTTTQLLRIASVISPIFAAGHTMGGLRKWSPMGDNAVVKAMTDVRFDTLLYRADSTRGSPGDIDTPWETET